MIIETTPILKLKPSEESAFAALAEKLRTSAVQMETLASQTANPALSIRPEQLLPLHSRHFYTHAGSLTTPLCSEGVQWFILQEAIEVSEKQIKAFNSRIYHDNARSEQKLNDRKLDSH